MPHPNESQSRYNVQVGHWRVQVPGKDQSEAIEQARRQLCQDLPRLWDVIHNLADDRFKVERAA
jgi:hypothetical protein